MKKNLTEIVVILDRSGSMASIWTDMIGGLNTFVEDQKKVPGEAKFTLIAFDNEYQVIYDCVSLQEVHALTGQEFPPRGSTALYDALGRTIDRIGTRLSQAPEQERPEKVLFNIITDGMNNASTEYSQPIVAAKIDHQQKMYAWKFLFLAANIDAQSTANSLNIKDSVQYTADTLGVRSMSEVFSASVTKSRIS